MPLLFVPVPAGVLSGAEMLAEFLTDTVDTPPDNNANEEPTEDEGGADSREESSPEGSLYEGEQEPEDEDDEDHEQIADKHEKLDRLKKMRKPKASKRHEPIPQNPAEKKVKPLPLSEDQRNVLLAFVAQVCRMHCQLSLMTDAAIRNLSLLKRNGKKSHSN